VRRVVSLGAVGDLDVQSSRLGDEQRQEAVCRDEMRVDREPQDAQADVDVVFPDRLVPLGRSALEDLGAPDVVDQHVDVAVIVSDAIGEPLHLPRIEMVERNRDACSAECGEELRRLVDGLGPVVLRWFRVRRAAGTDHRGASFAERCSDAATGASRRARDHGDSAVKG
jgi:hypothetical protein